MRINFKGCLPVIVTVLFVLLNGTAVWGDTEGRGFWENDYLFGDWGGARSAWEEKGVTLGLVYTGEWVGNLSGGIKKGAAYQGNTDLTMTLETGKAGWWDNGTFFIYALNTHHTKMPTERFIGDLQTASNIEAPSRTRLFEIWYEHQLSDAWSVLLGHHDLNSEFAVTEYGGLFLNSSFGIQPDISANTGLSIFPVVGPAIRIKYVRGDALEFLAGVYDGDPGDENTNPHGVKWSLSASQGALFIFESAYHPPGLSASLLPGTYKIGGWYHTGELADLMDTDGTGEPRRHHRNYGAYFIADQLIYRETEAQGLGIFVQIGGAPRDRNEVDFFIGGGINYLGLIPGRDADYCGVSVGHAAISRTLRKTQDRDAAETVLELTYKAQLTPFLSLQPDVQYVIHPGADPTLENAVVAMVRIETVF